MNIKRDPSPKLGSSPRCIWWKKIRQQIISVGGPDKADAKLSGKQNKTRVSSLGEEILMCRDHQGIAAEYLLLYAVFMRCG